MIHHLTLLDIVFWVLITLIQMFILVKTHYRTLKMAMSYLLVQSFVLLIIAIFGSLYFYSQTYYLLSTVESLILSLVAVELSSHIVSKSLTSLIRKAGPAVIAIPTFVSCIIFFPLKFTSVEFLINAVRVSEVSLILSLALLSFCTAVEIELNPDRKTARSYFILLFLLVICTEVQIRLGIYGTKMMDGGITTRLVRDMWPIAWLIGLSAIAISTKGKTSFDNFKSMTNGI